MGRVCDIADGWEYYISRAEIEFRADQTAAALTDAKLAQNYADTPARRTAIGIFIAKCYAALGDYEKSSQTYRSLIKDGAYLPPVLLGMMYNNLEKKRPEKVQKNLTIVKIFAEPDRA